MSQKNPQLPTLYELSHKATIHDVYDALEQIEFDKYLEVEQRNLEQQQEG